MHAYRDAIRNADGERVVDYAAILYPGPGRRFDPGLCALSAVPDNAAGLRADLRQVLSAAVART